MLQTKIAKIDLPTCIYNASGALCTSEKELKDLMDDPYTGAVISKSCTKEFRIGNPHPRYYEQKSPFLTINSTGLANLGYDFYGQLDLKTKTKTNKPYFISVSGLSIDDNLSIIKYMQDDIPANNIDAIELNLSCPNVIGKPQIGYDRDGCDNLLRRIFEETDFVHPIGFKLPPYFDSVQIEQMSDIFRQYPVGFLTCINSLGNGLVINPETEQAVIKPRGGLGGIGGSVIKPISLSNVYQFRQSMPTEVDIIGCGGVQNGVDVFEHILVGASAVQIGSQLVYEGISCFSRIQGELIKIMESKGYKTLDEFRGKLKAFDQVCI